MLRARMLLGLVALLSCSAPRTTARAHHIGMARGTWELVVFGGNERSIGDARWSGAGRLVATVDDALWFFYVAEPDRAERVRVGKPLGLAADPHTDVLAVGTFDSESRISILRGVVVVRTLAADSSEPGTSYQPAAVAPDGRTVVLRSNHEYDQEALRFVDVDTGVVHGAVAGEQALFDASGAYAIAGSTIYTRDLHELYGAPKYGDTGLRSWSSDGWIGTTAFLFSASGADTFDAKAGRAGVLPMPCKPPNLPSDRVDAEHGRVIRICEKKMYIASWPAATVQELLVPDTQEQLYDSRVEPLDPGSSFLAVPRRAKERAPIYRIDPEHGTVVREGTSDSASDCPIHADAADPFAWCDARLDASGTLAATVHGQALRVADVKRQQEVVRFGYATASSSAPEHDGATLVDGALEVRWNGERPAYRFAAPAPGPAARGSVRLVGRRLELLDPVGAVRAAREVDQTCRHAVLTDAVVMLLCGRNEGSEAIELGVPALEPIRQRALPSLAEPQRLERYGAFVLATGTRGQALLGTDPSAPDVGELFLWSKAGVLRDPRGTVLLAGARDGIERALWCVHSATGPELTEARSFSRCHAAFEAR